MLDTAQWEADHELELPATPDHPPEQRMSVSASYV